MKNLKIKFLTLTLSFCITTTATAMEKQKNKDEKNTKNSTNTIEPEEKKLYFEKNKTNNVCGFYSYMENVIKNTNINNKNELKKQS